LHKDSVQKVRFWKWFCIECNTKLLDGAVFCWNCGVSQYRECKSCKNSVPKICKYCTKCGK
jgi:ribosomal protein L40E